MVNIDMQIVNPQIIFGKSVLLRLDLDVPLRQAQGKLEVAEDFRLKADIPTLKLCIQNASKVIVIGHLGRPEKANPAFSLKSVCAWFKRNGFPDMTFDPSTPLRTGEDSKLQMLENLRFDPGEEGLDMNFAKKLAGMADIFVFEAFAAHRPAVSTTVLPTLLPHAAGLQFIREIRVIGAIRENPEKPFIAIMGGAKVADKLPVINMLAKKADAVLVGGKLVSELLADPVARQPHPTSSVAGSLRVLDGAPRLAPPANMPKNVLLGKLTEDGMDIARETVDSWKSLLLGASQIIWNGPVGRFEDPENDATKKIAEIILSSNAQILIGGGDSIAALDQADLLEKAESKAFVSTGGGAMLKFLADGALPTIKALN